MLNSSEQATTLARMFDRRSRQLGSRVFLKDKHQKRWRDHSWSEIRETVGRLRAGLAKLGVKPGDRVGILSDNCPQWVVMDQAILGLGGVVVPLYTTSGAEETRHVINDSGARIIAANGAGAVRRLLELSADTPRLATVIAMHAGAESQASSPGAAEVIPLESAYAEETAPIAEGSREDLATIIYTSGTTGTSKGVMLTHGNLLSNCEQSTAMLELNENDTVLSVLPIAHSFERTAGYYAVTMAGGTIAYAEGLSTIAPNLLEVRPTVLLAVPRLLEVIHSRILRTVSSSSAVRRILFNAAVATGKRAAWYRHHGRAVPPHLALPMAIFRRLVFARIRDIFGGRLRYLISGGAPLPTEIFSFLSAAEVPLVEGYGLTEAAPVVAVNLKGMTRIGTVGRLLPDMEAKTEPDGELLLRGPNVMKGYYQREQETREVLDPDGWLHTGDLARIDAEGFIAITGRKKEIIVLSGGKNVSPANLEIALTSDPYIEQACVVGDRRKHLAALLVPSLENLADFLAQSELGSAPPEEVVNTPAVRSLFQNRLREFNRQRSDVEAISAFALLSEPFSQENGELTPTLKVRRKVVEKRYRDKIEAMYRG